MFSAVLSKKVCLLADFFCTNEAELNKHFDYTVCLYNLQNVYQYNFFHQNILFLAIISNFFQFQRNESVLMLCYWGLS